MWEAVFFLVLTIIFWGTAPILEKYGLQYSDELSALFIRSTAIFVALVFIFIATGKTRLLVKVPLKSIVAFGASGILAGLVAMWTYFKVLKINPASKVVPLASTYPLITAILSIVLLREGLSWQRILGTSLIVAGVLLVK